MSKIDSERHHVHFRAGVHLIIIRPRQQPFEDKCLHDVTKYIIIPTYNIGRAALQNLSIKDLHYELSSPGGTDSRCHMVVP